MTPANPPENMPRITPAVFYDDAAAAIDWLVDAFGFSVREKIEGADGTVEHAELELADGLVMVGPTAAMEAWKSPKSLGGSVTGGLYIYVDDVDAHYAHAVARGAAILQEPVDRFFGDRMYRAVDPEGHQWAFATHVRDVSPEEMEAEGHA